MTPEQPNTPEQKEFKWTDAQMVAFGSYIKPSYDISKLFNKFKEAVKKFSLIEEMPPSVTSDHTTPDTYKEQLNTPELMAEYLISKYLDGRKQTLTKLLKGFMPIDSEEGALYTVEQIKILFDRYNSQRQPTDAISDTKIEQMVVEKSIWKFPLKVIDYQKVSMPIGATVLSIQAQNDIPCIWAIVDIELTEETEEFEFEIFGTGNPYLQKRNHFFIGTFQIMDGGFVGHVFQLLKSNH